MKDEINKFSNEINIDYQYLKTRRKVTGIEFMVFDAPKEKKQEVPLIPKEQLQDFIPSEEQIKALTYSQLRGYKVLVDFGVYEGIAYKQIMPTIKAGDLTGYEDIFIKESVDHFLKWTDKPKAEKAILAGTFVKWWTENKIFDSNKENTVYWKIADRVRDNKKKMKPEVREARLKSIGLPHEEFIQLYERNQETENQEYKNNLNKLREKMKV